MLQQLFNDPISFINQGGYLMWPLVVLFIFAFFLVAERMVFWLLTNSRSRIDRIYLLCQHLRRGEDDLVMKLVDNDNSVYGILTRELVLEGATPAVVSATVERLRPRIERFMTMLNSIITIAPMLGILGTVIGIIKAFEAFNTTEGTPQLGAVGGGIAEALLTTAFGLVIALLVVFPFNTFKTQIDRTLGRMESLIAAAGGDEDEADAFDSDTNATEKQTDSSESGSEKPVETQTEDQ